MGRPVWILFGVVLLSTAVTPNPCECNTAAESAGTPVRYVGCADHLREGVPWCYVSGGMACPSATPSSVAGAAWRDCSSLATALAPRSSGLPPGLVCRTTVGAQRKKKRIFADEGALDGRLRVVGGQPARRNSHPWIVRLSVSNLLCGGSLLTDQLVVTAAHCVWTRRGRLVAASDITVHAGDYDSLDATEPGEQRRGVGRIFSYPGYPADSTNDIALLQLASPLALSERVAPVCLPRVGFVTAGRLCYAAGWGRTSTSSAYTSRYLRDVALPIISDAECQRLQSNVVPETMLCAGDGRGDTCQGDSGGPLVCADGGEPILVGVTSWGIGCGRASNPGVYTDVVRYRSFIDSIVRGEAAPTAADAQVDESLLGERFEEQWDSMTASVNEASDGLICSHGLCSSGLYR